jgi:hypothetical protein
VELEVRKARQEVGFSMDLLHVGSTVCRFCLSLYRSSANTVTAFFMVDRLSYSRFECLEVQVHSFVVGSIGAIFLVVVTYF